MGELIRSPPSWFLVWLNWLRIRQSANKRVGINNSNIWKVDSNAAVDRPTEDRGRFWQTSTALINVCFPVEARAEFCVLLR